MAEESFSFSNDSVEYPSSLVETLNLSIKTTREYFLGLCSNCYTYKGSDHPLHRCSGCQLLAYCSKECQKADWSVHKPVCKKYPLKNGRNVLSELQKLKKDVRDRQIDIMSAEACSAVVCHLDKQSEQENIVVKDTIQNKAKGMFYWARVCNVCNEANVDKLTDCICHTVSYCSEAHRKTDRYHKDEKCYDFLIYARTLSYFQRNGLEGLNLPMNNEVDKEYIPVKRMEFNVSSMKDEWLDAKLAILSERLSHPLTILYAMQESGLGTNKKPVESVSSLDIHIVSPYPMLDSSMWEMLMHRLPNLDELNISFIGSNMRLENGHNVKITDKLERCGDCKLRKRLITYNIHPEHYHMYYSSMEYSEPDVIAVFNISDIRIDSHEPDIGADEVNVHQVTSLSNMTYDEDTLIVLTDSTSEIVEESIKEINEARPVDVIMSTKENPFRGFSSIRGSMMTPLINVRDWMACVKRK